MSRWWRAYDEAVDDPKLILLTDQQHRSWFNLCCIASQSGGVLPAVAVIAVKLRVKPDRARHVVAELVALGLVDHDGVKFEMHNWRGRQFKNDVTDPTNAERQRRYRKNHSNGTVTVKNVTDKRPDTERTETERKRDISRARETENSEAEKPKSPMIRPEAHTISDECYRALGIELQAIPPDWYALAYQIDMMLARGYDPPNIVATFAKLGGQKPLKPMNYFIKAVESSQQNQIKPAGAPSAKSGNVVRAIDKLVQHIAYFDQPAPDEAGVCSGEGQTPIRLLPPGRCQ